jgi:hypothetical protein
MISLPRIRTVPVCLFLAASVAACRGGSSGSEAPEARRYAREFTAVLVAPETPAPVQMAVQACAGLKNRALGGSVYVKTEPNDDVWLKELALAPQATVSAAAFLASCEAEFPACVRYDYARQQTLLPSILTVAAVHGALPLDVSLAGACGAVAFDAVKEFAGKATPLLATRYVYEHYLDRTTGLAMLNPGYDHEAADLAHPPLIRDMPTTLVDYVFAERLFAVFLVNGCVKGDPERALFDAIVNESPWPKPLGVYGYNSSWLIGGYLYEAQTRCLDSRNMGAIPTETGNLSFFATRRPPVTRPDELEHNAPETITYDPQMTYVAFVVGDGDNVRFVMTTRKDWLQERLAECTNQWCPPLTWSLSPHLPRLAPDVLRWYYRMTRKTGADYFILPPSGHFYAYPSSLKPAEQERFAAATERDARIMGLHSTVHWDFFDTWHQAEDDFLPRYARPGGAIRGAFTVNVPYSFPQFNWWPAAQHVKVLTGADGGAVAVFRQHEWRGVDDRDDEYFLSPEKMADRLGSYPPGTVTWVYMTSDGGLSLANSFHRLVALLPAHVRLVSADAAAELALAAGE